MNRLIALSLLTSTAFATSRFDDLIVNGNQTTVGRSALSTLTVSSGATVAGLVVISGGTATTVPYLNASKQITSSAVTPTELGYSSGVTSSLCGINQSCALTNKTSITSTTFVGALTGNSSTATALAANPTDCSSNNYATAIDAGGNLTCATVADAGLAVSYLKADGSRALTGSWNVGAFNITASTFVGALTGNATTATTATNSTNEAVTDDTTTNATMYPAWFTSNTGNLPAKVASTKLSFNPSTGTLASTVFSGAGTSLTGTASSLTAGTTAAINVSNDISSNTTVYPVWATGSSNGLVPTISTTKLTFNPSTGTLSSTVFSGAGTGLTGTASSLTVGNATNAVTATNQSGGSVSGTTGAFSGALTLSDELHIDTANARLSMYRTGGPSNFDFSSAQSLNFRPVTSSGGAGASNAFSLDGATGNATAYYSLGIGAAPSAGLGEVQVTSPTTYTGTFTVSAGGTTVTGTSSKMLTEAHIGDTVTMNAESRTIATLTSDTSFSTDAWTGANSSVAATRPAVADFFVQPNGNIQSGGSRTTPATNLSSASRGMLVVATAPSTGATTSPSANFEAVAYSGAVNGTSDQLILAKARGTEASPSPLPSGDTLGLVSFAGYDGASFSNGGQVLVKATEAWTSSAHGTQWLFRTNQNGTSSNTTAETIDQDQSVSFSAAVKMPGLATVNTPVSGSLCWTTSTGNVTVDATLACLSSTGEVKEFVQPIDVGLAEVMALTPISYHLKAAYNPQGLDRMVGFIAEDALKVDPRLVSVAKDGTVRGFRYMQFTAVLTKAIQEQQAQILALKAEVEDLRGRVK